MFHVDIMPIVTCYTYTSYHFYTFSGTNLLTRCHSASFCFLLFLYFRKAVLEIFSELDEKSSEGPISPTRTRSPKERRRRAREPPHAPSTRPRVGPRPRVVWAPWVPSAAALSPIYSTRRENPTHPSHYQRKVPEAPPSSTLAREGPKPLPGTLPERGIITGGLYTTMPASGVMRE